MNPRKKDLFDRTLDRIGAKIRDKWLGYIRYVRKLVFPVYLFPFKLVTYSLYYVLRLIVSFFGAILGMIRDVIVYPFTGMRQFLRFTGSLVLAAYIFLSLFVITDYLTKEYGYVGKFICSFGSRRPADHAVVRIIGAQSEGTGFFFEPNRIITNFHVIDGEPSPKIILPEGRIVQAEKLVGDKRIDLAVITVGYTLPEYLPLPDELEIYPNEPLIATGYALGSDLKGGPTVVRGEFIDLRTSRKEPAEYLQTTLSLVPGMSGGPLTDRCGKVLGINTQGLAGLSLFVRGDQAKVSIKDFTDEGIEKISVDPTVSPEEAVRAFYTYLKARRMEEGFKLLSREYLKKTNFQEWTGRFKDILDVTVISVKKQERTADTAFVKFGTKNWVDGEVDIHYYEGTWQTVKEDGVYKMLKSNIKEVTDPGWDWFYE